MQFHPSLPNIKGILQRYMPLLHQSVTMKTVVPDLPLISFSQPHNLCRSLCRAKLRQTASVNDEPPRPSQSCGKSRCKLCLSLICSNYISSTVNNKTFKCYNDNTNNNSSIDNNNRVEKNYKFIYYSNLPFSYYSQFTVIIFFDNSVTGYITLLCITIT